MKYIGRTWVIVWVLMAVWSSYSYGAIPLSVNYQGRLTDAVGAPVNDTVDLAFFICADSLCATQLWTESHRGVIVNNGLFDVLLGRYIPIQAAVFDGSVRFLSVSLGSGSVTTHRLALTSVGYAYKALNADTANYAKSGGGVDCADCNEVFVNVAGPDSVYTTTGTAFLGKSAGSSGSDMVGVKGNASNSSGYAYGGLFTTSNAGTSLHVGVKGDAQGASAGDVYGVQGWGNNTSTGGAYGGYFNSTTNGTGVHYGLYTKGWGNSSSATYGLSAEAASAGSGPVYGAAISAATGGTGIHFGAYVTSEASTSNTIYSVWGEASNTSTGPAYGGNFRATSSGTGTHYAINGNAYSASASDAYGSKGYASSTSSGDAYGGYFSTSVFGTGVHYAMKADGYGGSASPVHGVNGRAENTSNGTVYAGLFTAASTGTGSHYGSYAQSGAASAASSYGALGTASNSSTGDVFGVSGTATSTSSGDTHGGYFSTSNTGTGAHFGVVGRGYNDDATDCIGVYGYAANTGTGGALAGYFVAANEGTGRIIGVYGEAAPRPGYSWAGWFQGNLGADNDLFVNGSKSAAVQTAKGEYRALYSQESPEIWFEDFGEGQLINGRMHIELDPVYLQTVTIDARYPMKVFVQLEGDCGGVYVQKGTTGFDVNELKGGNSNVPFSYRVVAKRKGYEDKRLPILEGYAPDKIRASSAAIQARSEASRVKMDADAQRAATENKAAMETKAPPAEE